MEHFYLAVDLGAESGRVMLGAVGPATLTLEELHRFPNVPLAHGDELHWDVPALLGGIHAGLRKAAQRNLPIRSISTDSWGLDYVLLDQDGEIIAPTFHYRDPRTARGVESVRRRVPWADIFAETGIQFMPFNSIYQLAAENEPRLRSAFQMLPVADAINFHLCGVARAEESLASTTQLYNPRTRTWSERLIQALDLPRQLFPPIVPGGTRLGQLKPELAQTLGLKSIDVIAGCSHDTAAAVAAVPGEGTDWAYLSSGTWSLMGVEQPVPLLTDDCRAKNFTNEMGFGGTVRLLKNIIGLWIVQECRREWARQGNDWDYATLTRLASEAPAFGPWIDAADDRFVAPGGMPEKIAEYCREKGQRPPQTPGETTRCVLESLALLYRATFEQLEALLQKKLARLHIVGGGSRNDLLNQLTADALGVPVLAGPVEATALGNVLVQAIVHGAVPSLAAGRDLIRNSHPIRRFDPRPEDVASWEARFSEFKQIR